MARTGTPHCLRRLLGRGSSAGRRFKQLTADLHGRCRAGLSQSFSAVRYCARPPFALERLSVIRGEDGQQPKSATCSRDTRQPTGLALGAGGSPRAGANGVVELSPLDFLDRLSDLMPPPRKHRHRYHGAFAPSHRLATSAPMPTHFSIGVDLHRHTCGTGTFSSISPIEISSYRYRGSLQPACQYPDDP